MSQRAFVESESALHTMGPAAPIAEDPDVAEHWAAWQARGVANRRATRRKLFVMALLLGISAAILSGVWSR